MNDAADPVPEALTPAVLHVLVALAAEPRHGYSIMQAVADKGGPEMGPGTVYGTLQRLERAGLVQEADALSEGRRRVFRITPAGRAALQGEAERIRHVDALLRDLGLAAGEGR